MIGRVLAVAALSASGAVGVVLGTSGAALRTPLGREVIAGAAIGAANRALRGTLAVDSLGGSLLGGLEARGVVVRDTAGAVVARIARLRIRYRVRDLLGGRVVLGQVALDTPLVDLVQRPDGRLNLEEVLRLGEPGADGGRPGPLIAFRDARVRGGAVMIATPRDPGDAATGFTVRRIDGISADLPYARLTSPLPGQEAIRLELADLAANLSDPDLKVRGARGVLEVHGDSVTFDLAELRLPESRARLRGSLWLGPDGLAFDLAAQAAAAATNDLRGLIPRLPPGIDARGDFTVRSVAGDVLTFAGDGLTLVGRRRGGRATGRLGLVLGPGDEWGWTETRLDLENLDLEHVRPLLDTLPVAGRLSGRVAGTGPRTRLVAEIDWTFRDSLVPGWPVSFVRGGGTVRIGVPGEFVFERFGIRQARLDLGTVRRLLPAVELAGSLDGAGTLEGPWRELGFSGTLRHVDGARPASVARGTVRSDSRGDTLGVWADLALDSLDLTGVASALRGLPVRGAFAGELRLAGYADSLVVSGDLRGPGGAVSGGGAFTIVPPHVAVRALDVEVRALDLEALNPTLPPSRLNGRVTGDASVDTLAPPQGRLVVALGSSLLGGSRLDSLRGVFGARDSLLTVDSALAGAPGLRVAVRGGLALAAPRTADLVIRAHTDSLGVIAPLLAELAADVGTVADSVRGAATLNATVSGALDAYRLSGDLETPGVRWGPLVVGGATVRWRWGSAERAEVAVTAGIDTVAVGRFGFARVEARVSGSRDSLAWQGRSRIGGDAAWIAGGQFRTDSIGTTVPVDSLGVLLPTQAWFLDRGATLVARDSGIDLRGLILRSVDGSGAISADGRYPLSGRGRMRLSVEALPVADLWALLQYDPGQVGGLINGTVELEGLARAPDIRGTVALQDGVFGDFRAPHIEGTLSYRDRRLVGEFGLWRVGQRILDLDLDLPLDLALAAVPDRQLPGPLSIRARVDNLDLSFVQAMTRMARRTAGRMDADFGITGTWARPQLTGTVAVSDGAALLPALGVTHRAVNARIRLSADTIYVERLTLQSGEGTARVAGTVWLEGLTRPRLDLQVSGQNFRTIDVRNFLSLTASADLRLRGPVLGATLTGSGTATRGVLYFADLISKDVISLEDTLYHDIIDTSLTALIRRQGLGAEFQNRFLDSLRIDNLRLEMGTDVWLRSSEANIQLAGEVVASKIATRYLINGTLQTPRGTYRLPLGPVNREFTVTRGQVQYFGTSDLNAALDIDAQHVVRSARGDNPTVSVHVGGTLYVPKLTLSSDIRPPISETEIISYLLFGAPSFEALAGGGQRNSQLFQRTVGQLAGVVSGQLENLLISDLGIPLDYLAIRPGDIGTGFSGTEIALGRQLGSRWFLTVSPRLCPKQEVLRNLGGSVEFRVSQEWRLAASFDPVRACELVAAEASGVGYQLGFDLFWEKAF